MEKFTVYMHTNKYNGKRYIGITSQPINRRFRNGEGYKKNVHFYRAIKKIGWENFQHKVVAHTLTQAEAERLEIKLIAKYRTNDSQFGYNITLGGDGLNGYIPTEEKKRKTSIQTTGEKNPFYGKHHTPETLKRIAKINSIRMRRDGNPFYGKKHSKEARERLRKLHTGKPLPEDTKRKISEATSGSKNHFWGQTHSVEQKKRWSEMRAGAGNPRAKAVDRLTLDETYIDTYSTAKEAGEKLGICNTSITRCCKQQVKTAGGYKWRYSERTP